jgi:Big-like domain-containing protein
MTYSVVSDNGTATAAMNADGKTVEYTPAAGDSGKDVVITVKANDGTADSADVTITLTIG